jgi:hypothetical protein
MNFRMAINQADIPMIIQGAVNPPINQNQQSAVGGQTNPETRSLKISSSPFRLYSLSFRSHFNAVFLGTKM